MSEMRDQMTYEPRFTVTAKILDDVMDITDTLAKMRLGKNNTILPQLRRANRLRSLHSSLAIEGNSLSLDDVSAIIDGKKIVGPENEITDVLNAYAAYDMMDSLDPFSTENLLKVHGVMMEGTSGSAGSFRTGSEGVFDGDGNCIYLAPGPELVPGMIDDLLDWTENSDYPMMIKSCVFHYRFEYIHPFEDGNGRVGRLWQTLLLSQYDGSFEWIPVESVIRRDQKGYYDAIAVSNEYSDCTPFLEFMTGAILKALKEFMESSVREDAGCTERLTSNETVLYAMIRDGYYENIQQAADEMGVSRPTLNRILKSLRDKKVIRKEGNKKSGIWYIDHPGR